MLASMASFTMPNPALVRTVRLRRPAALIWPPKNGHHEVCYPNLVEDE